MSHAARRSGAVSVILLALAACGGMSLQVRADTLLQTFTLKDNFGVSHSNQVVTFDLAQPVVATNCYLLDGSGAELPYQVLSGGSNGQLALATDLPANTNRAFQLYSGRAPGAFPGVVTVDASDTNYYQICNGLTGIRVPKVYSPLPLRPKSPIQGVQFRDGTWSLPGTVVWLGSVTNVNSMSVTFLQQGPLRTVVSVSYGATCVAEYYGQTLVRPAGAAHYTTTITVEKGQPSVLFETDTDLDSATSVSLYAGVHPTQFRYMGHSATDPVYGHLTNGAVYAGGNLDALVDISYTNSVDVSYVATAATRPWMALWNPWIANSGWYWQLYDAAGATNANIAGIFAGSPARLIAAGASGPGVYNHTDPDAGITIMTWLRGPDATLYYYLTSNHTIRFDWGIFTGVKGPDLPADVTAVSTIAKQFCLHGNGVSLDKLAHWQLEYPDPVPAFGAMYMSRTTLSNMISRCRTDTSYYNYLYSAEAYSRDIWDVWRDTTGAKAHQMVTNVHVELANYIDDWENGFGYLSQKYTTQPWLIPAPKSDRYDQLLANEYLAADERTKVKADAAFFANWLWDYDVYPVMTDPTNGNVTAGVNMGTANMPGQWTGTRSSYTWYLASHPAMTAHLAEALPKWYMISTNGEANASPHYAGTITPQFNVTMQRNMLGYHDWATEPKLPKFADWLLNLVTPAEVRFNGKRSMIVDGDGEADQLPSLFGENAMACLTDAPTQSPRLMWMWKNNGKPHNAFYGSTVLRIDEGLATQDPQLGNAAFPGYYAVLRSGWNTPKETSVHAIIGSWYFDHRTGNSGSVDIYALGAPLSLDWEGMYAAPASSSYMHSTVIPEAKLGFAWTNDIPDLATPGDPWRWGNGRQDVFASFSQSGYIQYHTGTSAGDLTWSRRVASIHPDADYPLILIRDDLSGTNAGNNMTCTFTLMATGAVATAAGSVTPATRFYDINGAQQMASGGAAYDLLPGLNKFSFTGRQFGVAGVTPAIDWDLYDVAPTNQQFCLGSWGHNNAGSYSGGPDYQAANGVAYEQRQYLLHLYGAGGFKTLLVPRRKGAAAPGVATNGSALAVTVGAEITWIGDDWYSFSNAAKIVLSTYSAAPAAAYGLSVEGGPTEAVWDKSARTITLAVHGGTGLRKIGLPGTWYTASGGLSWDGGQGKWLLDYSGGDPGSAVFVDYPVSAAPVVLTHPISQAVNAGQAVSFSVAAAGAAPLAYQWRKDSAILPGATGATTTIAAAQAADAGGYAVVVSNSLGVVTSSTAVLTVNVTRWPGWLYGKTITVDHTQVSGTQTDFPALVVVGDDHDLASHARPDGNDLVFTDTSANPLAFEVESYAPTGGPSSGARGVFWVRIPRLDAAADTAIRLLYGNPACGVSRQQAAQVWDSHYQGVWHFGAAGLSVADSTGKNASTGTGSPAARSGKINAGVGFNGSAQYIDAKLNLSAWSRMTIEGWGNRDATNGVVCVAYESDSPSKRTGLRLAFGLVMAAVGGTESFWPLSDSNAFHHLVLTYDGTLSTPQYWLSVDGVNRSLTGYNAPAAALPAFANSFKIGMREDASQYSSGIVDEVRVSDIARSSGWIATEDANQNNPAGFASPGAEWLALADRGTPMAWLGQYGLTNDLADDDGDGVPTWQECLAGTNPTNASSVLRIAGLTNQAPGRVVYFTTATNRQYALEYTTNLAGGAWTNLPGQTNVWGTGAVMPLGDTNTDAVRFYRIGLRAP